MSHDNRKAYGCKNHREEEDEQLAKKRNVKEQSLREEDVFIEDQDDRGKSEVSEKMVEKIKEGEGKWYVCSNDEKCIGNM